MDTPNIIWITLDSVRADHTTIGGYERNTTPGLESIASDGVGFQNCIAHSRWTLPSSGAILTGQAPSRTTLGITGDVLPESVKTIAERFRDAGYQTAALSGNSFVGEDTELDRGFERFQWLTSSTLHEISPSILFKYLTNIRTHSAGLTLDASKHSTPILMNAIAKRWIRDFASVDSPFFYYLHYNEPHRPYYPPLAYRDRFTEDIEQTTKAAAETAMCVHRNLNEIIANGADLTEDEWDSIVAMYDAEIAYTDLMIGRLIKWIENQSLGETIVVITADHGELFGEYGLLSHKFVLHDGLTRVPLVLKGISDELAVGQDDLIQHVDVMKTLLNISGADTNGVLGFDLRNKRREFAISQRGPSDFEQILDHNADWDRTRFHEGLLTALRTLDWKYQKSDRRSDLFNLPDENEDVSVDYPDVVRTLDEKLETWAERHGKPVVDSREAEFSEATKKQLRELGYIN